MITDYSQNIYYNLFGYIYFFWKRKIYSKAYHNSSFLLLPKNLVYIFKNVSSIRKLTHKINFI